MPRLRSSRAPAASPPESPWRRGLRLLLASAYAVAGVMHLIAPGDFVRITPGWVPMPDAVVLWTGVAEIIGSLALAQPWSLPLRRAAGVALAAYAVCVFPANIKHLLIDAARPEGGWGWGYHGPRMLLQPLLVWLALWCAHVINWPFARRTAK